jgi:predicted NBD/HSP70 family sugar kinase
MMKKLSVIPHISANERMILDIIRRSDGIARSAITAETNLTQQSVHRILDGLVEKEYLYLGEAVVHGRGKPSPEVHLNPQTVYSIGVSLNTDSMLVTLIDFCGRTLIHDHIPFSPVRRNQTLDWLKITIANWLTQYPHLKNRIIGVGFGITGYFMQQPGFIRTPPLLPDWRNINLIQLLEELLGLPIWLMNNATTGAIGETLRGVGLKYQNFAYLSFNFGFGAGVVINGEPFFGAFGNAGEIGRIYTADEMPRRPALGELLKLLQKHGTDIHSIPELRDNFNPDWDGVADWVEQVTPYLIRAINAFRSVIDPDAIVLGGELPKSLGDLLLQSLHQHKLSPPSDISAKPEILISELAGHSSVLGAALLPLRDVFFRQ